MRLVIQARVPVADAEKPLLLQETGGQMRTNGSPLELRVGLRVALCLCGTVFASPQIAAGEITASELLSLSPVCRAVLQKSHLNRAERLRPYAHLVSGSCGIIHTCAGELALVRYRQWSMPYSSNPDVKARNERKRNDLLGTAAAEFSYEIRCAPSSYPLLPMIHTGRGNALSLGNRHKEALADFARALELDPNYGPAKQGLAAAQARAAMPKSGR